MKRPPAAPRPPWRYFAWALLLVNLLLWLWLGGHLRWLGLGLDSPREPERMLEQIDPQAITLREAASVKPASAPSATEPASSAASAPDGESGAQTR